ncbi:MAG: hypothetical protein COA85_06255 [Robiginitomaculum sp.]|nr:MAG: hypothetical protein COA85_06255 [Robiginitomaculum sp.]
MISFILTGTIFCLPALAQASDHTTKAGQGTLPSHLEGLRKAGSGSQIWPTQKPAFIVYTHLDPAMKVPVSVLVHIVGAALQRHAIKGHKLFIKHYIQGENKKSWYALAGAGGHAVALKPGSPIESDGLRLQGRAKIGVAQLGMARDIGGGRVILGYLRNNTRRDALIPYSTRKERQNMAALTLTIKR